MNTLLIAQNTFREAVRDRVLAGILVGGQVLLGLTRVGSALAMGEDLRLTVDLGLSSISLLGLLVILLVGTSLVAKEIERETIFNLLSRPLPRPVYLVGKWAGLTGALALVAGVLHPPLSKGGMWGWSSLIKGGLEGLLLENCILGPGFKIDLSESDFFDSTNGTAFLIGTGGSDRKYYRVKSDDHSEVLMKCPDNDPDFQRQIEYTRFFKRHSIPVPELIDAEPDKMSAFLEDLGDLSRYSWLKCPREQKQIEKIYKQVIDILVSIHTVVTEHVSECPLLQRRIFDYEYLRWETGYLVWLASSPEVAGASGGYYAKRRLVTPSRAACDAAAARRLWEAS